MAAVYCEIDGNKTLIGSCDYDTPEQSFGIKIVGANGKYQVFLTPTKNIQNKVIK